MSHDSDVEGALAEVVEELDRLRAAGEAGDVDALVARHPEHADEVRRLLGTLDLLHTVDPPSTAGCGFPMPTRRIGEYELERELGRGGMGVVHLAVDRTLGRRVALKLLPVQATLDPRFLRRFEREARAAALLSHPNIVPVHGVGEHEGLRFFAMQYVDGRSLDAVVRAVRDGEGSGASEPDPSSAAGLAHGLLTRDLSEASSSATARGPISPRNDLYCRNVAWIGSQVADALAYAHGRGVLHRDVKPANLLMQAGGHTWVGDFGLCKTGEPGSLTRSHDLVGTLRYMSPEQLEGAADVRSDVYALGATLYELLTLRPAFPGSDRPALVRAIADVAPPRPRRLRRDLPGDLEAIVLRAMAKLPEERYGTADALAADLRAFLSGRAVSARAPDALHLVRVLVRRNRIASATIAVSLVVLGVATVLFLRSLGEARAEERRQLYLATVSAAAAVVDELPDDALRMLELAPQEHRSWEWNHLRARVDDSLETVERASGPVRDLDVSLDGSTLAFVEGGRLRVRELGEGQRSWSADVAEYGTSHCAISDRGDRVWVQHSFTLDAWAVGEELRREASWVEPVDIYSVGAHSASGRVFLGLITGEIRALEADLSREAFSLTGHGAPVTDLAVSASGATLVSSSQDGTVRIWDLGARTSRTLEAHETEALTVDVSRDGRWLASGAQDGTVRLWDAVTGELLRTWREHRGHVRKVHFSPDARSIGSSSDDRSIRIWSADRATSERVLRGHGNQVLAIDFRSADELLSADTNGLIKRWDPRVAGGRVWLDGHLADSYSVHFDSTGELLVSTNRDGTVRLWDAVTGRQVRVLVGLARTPQAAVLSPRGDLVATGENGGVLRLFRVRDGREAHAFAIDDNSMRSPHPISDLRFSPDGGRIFGIHHQRAVLVWELRGEEVRLLRAEPLDGALFLAVSPNGRFVAATTMSGEVSVFDAEPWRLRSRFGRPWGADGAHSATFFPDGRRLLRAGVPGVADTFDVMRGELLASIQLEPEGIEAGRGVLGLGLAAEAGRFVAANPASGTRVWSSVTGEPVMALRGPGRGHVRTAFSGDGERIATSSWDGVVRVWDTLDARDRRARLLARTSREEEARALFEELTAELGDPFLVRERIVDLDVDPELREQALRLAHEASGTFEALLAHAISLQRPAVFPEGAAGARRVPSAASRALGALLRTAGPVLPKPPPTHDVSAARHLAHGLIKENSEDARVLRTWAESELVAGNLENAEQYLANIVEASEADGAVDVEARALLAVTLARLGRAKEATVMLERARTQHEPGDPRVDDLLDSAAREVR